MLQDSRLILKLFLREVSFIFEKEMFGLRVESWSIWSIASDGPDGPKGTAYFETFLKERALFF